MREVAKEISRKDNRMVEYSSPKESQQDGCFDSYIHHKNIASKSYYWVICGRSGGKYSDRYEICPVDVFVVV